MSLSFRPQQRVKSVSVDHTGSSFIPANTGGGGGGETGVLHVLAAAERRRLFQRRPKLSESRRTSFQVDINGSKMVENV